jgi:glyoxylase-like metal-dependent hydrolase (beta-lactamase superfamily II)
MTVIHAFHTGHCTHPSCMAVKGSGFASRCFPSQAYLLETRQGFVLWDTGYASHFKDASSRGVYRLYPAVTPVSFDASQAMVHQLRERGIEPRDVHTVILSHFHADHMAGLLDFPRARVIASAVGWEAVRGKTGLAALRQAFLPALMPHDIDARLSFAESFPRVALPLALTPFSEAFDVMKTGEVLIVPLPGHAPGHLGAFVQTESGWVLLAADAAWAPEAYTQLTGPSELSFLIQDSRKSYYATLRQLKALHDGGAARIALTHVEDDFQ